MDRYYSESANAIAEYLNAFGMKLDRSIPINEHSWWETCNSALINILNTYFKKHNIVITLTNLEKKLLQRRASLRGNDYNLTHEELFIYDIVDMFEYYNYEWEYNPPFEYIIPQSFSL
jgi:hypothetical protein